MAGKAEIAVVGGGAAGCFAAVRLKELMSDCRVTVYESADRPLRKLALTGGGRCNITNRNAEGLKELYPRGFRAMKGFLREFSAEDAVCWFEAHGLPLKEEEGGRMFPKSDSAMDVVRLLEREMKSRGVTLRTGAGIRDVSELKADAVLVTTGGAGARGMLPAEVALTPEAPSLFSFKLAGCAPLMGLSTSRSKLVIPGTDLRAEGPVLITDWGLSGPAVLRLSSYAAYHLKENSYKSDLIINWAGVSEAEFKSWADGNRNASRQVSNVPFPGIPHRLWEDLLERSGLRADLKWCEMGGKQLQKLCAAATADCRRITGRAPFRDEFVTAGGVALEGLNGLESKAVPSLFFAGEVLDIDAVTGGFNLQAAWTTAAVAASRIAGKILSLQPCKQSGR